VLPPTGVASGGGSHGGSAGAPLVGGGAAAVLLLLGAGTALRMRRRPHPAMGPALSAPALAAPPRADRPPTTQAFDRLPEHIQQELREIGDLVQGMDGD
jgi:hypothetical protein